MVTTVASDLLLLYNDGTNKYGAGIAGNELQLYTPSGGHISFGTLAGTTFTEYARVASGSMLIGSNAVIDASALATQANQETATSTTTFVSPGRQQYHPSAAKVFALFTTVTTTALTRGYNVSSLTDDGVGATTINFTTAFSAADYAVVGSAEPSADNNPSHFAPFTTTPTATKAAPAVGSVKVFTFNYNYTGPVDPSRVSVAIYGDQ
jgi:hypothetical protein